MKFLRILVVFVVILSISAVAAVATVNYLADRIIDEGIAKQIENSAAKPQDSDKISQADAENKHDTNPAVIAKRESSSDSVEDTLEVDERTEVIKEDQAKTSKVQLQADKILNETTSEKAPSNELEKVSQQVLPEEKLEVLKIIVSKLSAQEISELSAMVANGVDQEEQKTLEVFYSRLTPEELEYLKELYDKYLK